MEAFGHAFNERRRAPHRRTLQLKDGLVKKKGSLEGVTSRGILVLCSKYGALSIAKLQVKELRSRHSKFVPFSGSAKGTLEI